MSRKPAPSHYLMKILESKNYFQTNFTTNIDYLEQKVNLNLRNIIHIQGANIGAQCCRCKNYHDQQQLEKMIRDEKVMVCNLKLPTPARELVGNSNKGLTYKCKFAVKPRLMFFGESIPESVKQGLDKITDSNW